jgi:hypothetical protein
MKIHTHQPYGEWYTAIDEDTYDGAPDSHALIGIGISERAAIEDLVNQVIEKLEEHIDLLHAENKVLLAHAAQETERMVQALNRRVTEQIARKGPETDALQARGDLQIEKEYHHSGLLDEGHGEAHSDVVTPDEEQLRFQGRLPDEPPEWASDYDEPSPDR